MRNPKSTNVKPYLIEFIHYIHVFCLSLCLYYSDKPILKEVVPSFWYMNQTREIMIQGKHLDVSDCDLMVDGLKIEVLSQNASNLVALLRPLVIIGEKSIFISCNSGKVSSVNQLSFQIRNISGLSVFSAFK